eukprot:3949269-Alexandrium_andersonii.AAC.1
MRSRSQSSPDVKAVVRHPRASRRVASRAQSAPGRSQAVDHPTAGAARITCDDPVRKGPGPGRPQKGGQVDRRLKLLAGPRREAPAAPRQGGIHGC